MCKGIWFPTRKIERRTFRLPIKLKDINYFTQVWHQGLNLTELYGIYGGVLKNIHKIRTPLGDSPLKNTFSPKQVSLFESCQWPKILLVLYYPSVRSLVFNSIFVCSLFLAHNETYEGGK